MFKITLGPLGAGGKQVEAPVHKKQEQQAPAAVKSSVGSHAARIPLIKFLGASRKSINTPKASSFQSAAPLASTLSAAQSQKPLTIHQEGNRIIYESAEMLPKRYQTRPFTETEMNVINVSISFFYR